MINETGMWVDHRKAVIVTLLDKKESIQIILSNIDNNARYSTEAPANLPKSKIDPSQEQKMEQDLGKYYSEIAYKIRDTDSILIFGPDKAKVELAARLKQEKLGGKIASVDTVDNMTDRQISEKVHAYFIKA